MRSSSTAHSHGISPARGLAASAIFLAMLVSALALWTAVPLGWIYIGSKASQSQFPSAGPYAIVAIGILVSIVLVAWLIGLLNSAYVRVTGTNRLSPMRPSWLKSMRDTSPSANATTVVEAVMMGSVLLALVAFVIWFLLLAGSPLPDQ